jgi:hydroxypyruvate reductase
MNGRDTIRRLFSAAIARVDPIPMITSQVSVDGETLRVRTEIDDVAIPLDRFDRVVVVGAGKASARMALGIERVFGDRIAGGVIAVKPGHIEKLRSLRLIEAGHPVPDDGSVRAGREIAGILDEADERTLVLSLISGGGSALLTLPYDREPHSITLDDMRRTTEALLASGADIREINTLRKHLSAIKGGRAAARAYPATTVSLILSDVVGDDLSSIASGLTSPDIGTYADALAIVRRYEIEDAIPRAVLDLLTAGTDGAVADTPKPGDEAFSRTHNILIGTNAQALIAAAGRARELGLNPVVLSSRIEGEAREVARFYAAIARDLVRFGGDSAATPAPLPACIIAGGETTVTLRGDGLGGRNQEMAAAFLAYTRDSAELARITFFSGGTDGNDGPTDAAGGWADAGAAHALARSSLSIEEYLERNDSYNLLKSIDALEITGPTNTNVCDIQIVFVESAD